MQRLRRAVVIACLSAALCLFSGCQQQTQPPDTPSDTPDISQEIILPTPDLSQPEPSGSAQPEPPVPTPEPEPEPAPEPKPQPDPVVTPEEPKPEPEPVVIPEEPKPEPVPAPEKKPVRNTKLYVLMYHHVVPDGTNCNDWTITESRLREDLQWLKDNGYTWVLPRELAAGEPLPEKAVMVTFDDGYASNYHLAYPIFQELEAKAVISVITKRIEDGKSDYLTWDMCREMNNSGLVEFGSHTHDLHNGQIVNGIIRLPDETREQYEQRVFTDLLTSKELIETNLDTPVTFFAYPHGLRDDWGEDFVEEHFAVTVITKHGPASIKNNLYDFPRHNITVATPVSNYLP